MTWRTLFSPVLFAAAGFLHAEKTPLPPWRDPTVFEINRLPARAIAVPCESEEMALAIARGERPRTDSKWLESLNGEWDFKWKHTIDAPAWEKTGKITVPGCWQLQGDFDPPLYVNQRFPIAGYQKGDPMETPPKDYTSFYYRNPVGLYSRTFTLPADWQGRRTVIHFGGVSSAMYVRLNGHDVGYSEDSRLPAEFDLTPYLAEGENRLEVEVLKHSDGTFLEDQDFWRLSGIFRDVWLVSEQPGAAKDLIVEATLSNNFQTGTLIVRDENGRTLLERTYPKPTLWDVGSPHLYTAVIPFPAKTWRSWVGLPEPTDYRAVTFGFRTVEIRDAVVYINGKRALFKGVNRHEMSPEGGYTVTQADMEKDLAIYRNLGINASRTSHYPNDPTWYELCDRTGIYVCSEANVEAHGVNNYYGKNSDALPKNPRYHDAIVSRSVNMVKTFRNHPSVIFWSLGNESGDGPAMKAAYDAVKALDPTRPIQYEPACNTDHSDIICPMYAPASSAEAYVKNNPKKPYILCEYAHAMGNSTGSFADYWKLAERYPSFQGGFIWDFADQALWKRDARGQWLAFGGDFGDKPNDDNFNCNGLVDALRNLHPGAYDVKAAYTGKLEPTPSPAFQVRPLPPTAGAAPSPTPFALNFWRAPTDNDRGWNMPRVCSIWKQATETQTPPAGVSASLSALKLSAKTTLVSLHVSVPDGLPPIPRVGLSFTLPGDFTHVAWEGRGPHENYSDRILSANFGSYTAVIRHSTGLADASGALRYPEDRLNPDTYSEPGEQGYRTDCRRLSFTNSAGKTITVTALNAPFGFNAWPYSQRTLEAAHHQWELTPEGRITVNLDAVQMGVGGDNSWGARPHRPFMPGKGEYTLHLLIEGLD